MKLAVIDLDGVVANNHARERVAKAAAEVSLDVGGHYDDTFWSTMFDPALVEIDEPIPGAAEALLLLESAGIAVTFLTSRPETMRSATEAWLHKHGLQGLPDSAPWRELLMKDFEIDRYTKTDQWKARVVHGQCSILMPDFVLFVDDEEKNRVAVQDLGLIDTKSWIVTDSLTNNVIASLVSVQKGGPDAPTTQP